MTFGDGIDWSAEARRQKADDDAKGQIGIGRSELIDKLAEYLKPGARVLDAGCNIGRYCPLVQAAGLEYVGVDQSDEALALAAQINPTARFQKFYLWEMEFDRVFDAAMCLAVLQHNTLAEQARIIPQIAKALVPGGYFLMAESTVREFTKTQRTNRGWIDLVTHQGFALVLNWHPNPEFGDPDWYLFRRDGEAASAPPPPKGAKRKPK